MKCFKAVYHYSSLQHFVTVRLYICTLDTYKKVIKLCEKKPVKLILCRPREITFGGRNPEGFILQPGSQTTNKQTNTNTQICL